MEAPTPSLREQGKQALKDGELEKAVDFLARAVMADDNDVESKALLGIVYSQKGLHAQAKRALQTAVEREPQNVNTRFNLGVVCERAGDMQGAAIAFRDTLQLNPQHAQAKAKLQAIPNVHQLLAAAPKQTGPVGVPTYQPGDAPGGAQGAAAMPAYSPPAGGYAPPAAPPAYAPPTYAPPTGNPLAPPPSGGGYSSTGMDAPPGTVQCPSCRQFSRVGLACEFCSGPLPAPEPKPAPSAYGGAPSTYGAAPPAYGAGPGYRSMAPHRGGTVLTLGILSLLCNCFWVPSILAITYGNKDIAEMDSGYMDPSGRGMTQAGRVMGIIGACLSAVGIVIRLALLFASHGR